MTGGDHRVFVEDPIAFGLLITAAVFVIGSAIRNIREAQKKRAAAQEEARS